MANHTPLNLKWNFVRLGVEDDINYIIIGGSEMLLDVHHCLH